MKSNFKDFGALSQSEHNLPIDDELLKNEKWLTPTEIMSYLKVSRSALYRFSNNKKLPYFQGV